MNSDKDIDKILTNKDKRLPSIAFRAPEAFIEKLKDGALANRQSNSAYMRNLINVAWGTLGSDILKPIEIKYLLDVELLRLFTEISNALNQSVSVFNQIYRFCNDMRAIDKIDKLNVDFSRIYVTLADLVECTAAAKSYMRNSANKKGAGNVR